MFARRVRDERWVQLDKRQLATQVQSRGNDDGRRTRFENARPSSLRRRRGNGPNILRRRRADVQDVARRALDVGTGTVGVRAGDTEYAHAIHPHTEEQLEAATQMLKEKHEKRVGPRGERVATKIVQNLRKDDGAFNFRVAEREKQKSQLTTRVELQTTQSKWNTEEYFKNDEWLYNSTEAMFVNSYLPARVAKTTDGFKKPHDDVEHTLKAFEMGLERLESLGLVHLHPDVVMVPPLGGKKQLEKDREEMRKRQDRIRRGLSEFEDDEFTAEEEEEEKEKNKNHHHEEL